MKRIQPQSSVEISTQQISKQEKERREMERNGDELFRISCEYEIAAGCRQQTMNLNMPQIEYWARNKKNKMRPK